MGQPIVVRGIEGVVEAYRLNGVGPFAVCCGKMILFSSEDLENDEVETGGEQLRGFLTLIEKSGTEGKYILQMYRLKEGEEIDSGTRFFRAFPFSLWTGEGSMQPYSRLKNDEIARLNARIEAMELAAAERELETEEEDQGAMGKIGKVLNGLMDMPQVRDAIGAFIVSKVMPMTKLGKVAGLEGERGTQTVLDEDQAAKAQAAINVLAQKDPQLGDHLTAIAKIATEDPARYSFLVGMLK